MKIIYIAYIRSVLEKSCQVWHSSITEDNSDDLERILKNAMKIILQDKFTNYENALHQLNIQDLKTRREDLCKKFAKSCLSNEKNLKMFPKRGNLRSLRKNESFHVNYARTERYKNTSIQYMQRQLNRKF